MIRFRIQICVSTESKPQFFAARLLLSSLIADTLPRESNGIFN